MKNLVLPIIRMDRAVSIFDREVELRTTAVLSELVSVIDAIRRRCRRASLTVAANPLVLHWAARSSDRLQELVAHFREAVEAGVVEYLPSPIVKGLSPLAELPAALHLQTAAWGIAWPEEEGHGERALAGLSPRDVDIIGDSSDVVLQFALCDSDTRPGPADCIAPSRWGTVCFQYREPCEDELRRRAGDVTPVALYEVAQSRQEVQVVSAAALPELLEKAPDEERIVKVSKALPHLLLRGARITDWEGPVSASGAQNLAFDQAELSRRVEKLFVRLICETVGKALRMSRDKISAGNDPVLKGSAVGTFLLPRAMAQGALTIRLASPHESLRTAIEKGGNAGAREASTAYRPTNPHRTERSDANTVTGLFLDLLAQSLWLHGRYHQARGGDCEPPSDWLIALRSWLERSLFDAPQFAIGRAPQTPAIGSLRILRDALCWNALRYHHSVINRELAELQW